MRFSCEVQPVPSANLTYKWQYIANHHKPRIFYGQRVNLRFSILELTNIRIFCNVSLQQIHIGSAIKAIKVHGKLLKCMVSEMCTCVK